MATNIMDSLGICSSTTTSSNNTNKDDPATDSIDGVNSHMHGTSRSTFSSNLNNKDPPKANGAVNEDGSTSTPPATRTGDPVFAGKFPQPAAIQKSASNCSSSNSTRTDSSSDESSVISEATTQASNRMKVENNQKDKDRVNKTSPPTSRGTAKNTTTSSPEKKQPVAKFTPTTGMRGNPQFYFPDRKRDSNVIPHFARNGTALTQEERAAIAKRKGLCVKCGVKTHIISVFKKTKITNEKVYDGVCIKCNPTSVPSSVLQEYELRNPRHSAPVVPLTRGSTPRVPAQLAAKVSRAKRHVANRRPAASSESHSSDPPGRTPGTAEGTHLPRPSGAPSLPQHPFATSTIASRYPPVSNRQKNRVQAYTARDDRDIIPIRDIWNENLELHHSSTSHNFQRGLSSKVPSLQDAQDLWLDSYKTPAVSVLDLQNDVNNQERKPAAEPESPPIHCITKEAIPSTITTTRTVPDNNQKAATDAPLEKKSIRQEPPTKTDSSETATSSDEGINSSAKNSADPSTGSNSRESSTTVKVENISLDKLMQDRLSIKDDDVLSLGTLTSGGAGADGDCDGDDCSFSTYEDVSLPDDKTAGSWSLCSGDTKQTKFSQQTWDRISMAKEDPRMWAISYQQLLAVGLEFQDLHGDTLPNATMRDVNRLFITPLCQQSGTSFALQQNPSGLLVDAFISHCWDEPFHDFVNSIKKVFQTWVHKPNLWICAFALNQSDAHGVKTQVGTDDASLSHCPFVVALEASQKFVVVRNAVTDLYSRIWCVCELLYARKLGFVPEHTFVTGPDCFAESKTSCIDAQATNTNDKAKILSLLLNQYDYKEIDEFVQQFRSQDAPE